MRYRTLMAATVLMAAVAFGTLGRPHRSRRGARARAPAAGAAAAGASAFRRC